DRLSQALAGIGDLTDQDAAHRARVAGKRLRYLVEPLAEAFGEELPARELVDRLKSLQDTIGEMHDAHVHTGDIADALEEVGRERARELADAVRDSETQPDSVDTTVPRPVRRVRDERAGLLELARRLRQRIADHFAVLE